MSKRIRFIFISTVTVFHLFNFFFKRFPCFHLCVTEWKWEETRGHRVEEKVNVKTEFAPEPTNKGADMKFQTFHILALLGYKRLSSRFGHFTPG